MARAREKSRCNPTPLYLHEIRNSTYLRRLHARVRTPRPWPASHTSHRRGNPHMPPRRFRAHPLAALTSPLTDTSLHDLPTSASCLPTIQPHATSSPCASLILRCAARRHAMPPFPVRPPAPQSTYNKKTYNEKISSSPDSTDPVTHSCAPILKPTPADASSPRGTRAAARACRAPKVAPWSPIRLRPLCPLRSGCPGCSMTRRMQIRTMTRRAGELSPPLHAVEQLVAHLQDVSRTQAPAVIITRGGTHAWSVV